jgi:hypothetical protein
MKWYICITFRLIKQEKKSSVLTSNHYSHYYVQQSSSSSRYSNKDERAKPHCLLTQSFCCSLQAKNLTLTFIFLILHYVLRLTHFGPQRPVFYDECFLVTLRLKVNDTPVVQPCFGHMVMSGVWSLTITHAASAHNTTHSRLKHVPCYSMIAPTWRLAGAVELAKSARDKARKRKRRRSGSSTAGMNRS